MSPPPPFRQPTQSDKGIKSAELRFCLCTCACFARNYIFLVHAFLLCLASFLSPKSLQTNSAIVVIAELLQELILSTFLEKQNTSFFLMKIVSVSFIYTNYILTLIRWEWLSCFYYFFVYVNEEEWHHFELRNWLFDTDQNAQLSLLTYLRLMQFSYTKRGSFPDSLMSLNEIRNFHTLR